MTPAPLPAHVPHFQRLLRLGFTIRGTSLPPYALWPLLWPMPTLPTLHPGCVIPAAHQDARGLHSAPPTSLPHRAGRPVRCPGCSCGIHVPSLCPLPPLGYASAMTLQVRQPPLRPTLASQAAEKCLRPRRLEGPLKDTARGCRAERSSGPSCHLCGCPQSRDGDHWASVCVRPS